MFELPACCQNCQNYDWDYNEWSDSYGYYCLKNVWWPLKKQTCKKQVPYKDERGGA
jgi:hypothetical protein